MAICPCGQLITRRQHNGREPRYCSKPCQHRFLKSRSGGYVTPAGYRRMAIQGRGRVFEHVLVMEQKLGRWLRKGERVHHLNHVRLDNRPENLMLMANGDHTRMHEPWKLSPMNKPGHPYAPRTQI